MLGPLLFLIMLADINKDISESNLISFADDTRMYTKINDLTDCNTLQQDLNHVYDWASANNMFFNAQKLYYVSFSSNKSSSLSNVYINLQYNIISHPQMYLILVCICLAIVLFIYMLQMYIGTWKSTVSASPFSLDVSLILVTEI